MNCEWFNHSLHDITCTCDLIVQSMFNYTLICFIINTHCLHVTYWFIFQHIVQINNVRLIAIQSHDIIDPTHCIGFCVFHSMTRVQSISVGIGGWGAGVPQIINLAMPEKSGCGQNCSVLCMPLHYYPSPSCIIFLYLCKRALLVSPHMRMVVITLA